MERKPKLPKDLLSGLYQAEFVPEIEDLNEFVFNPEDIVAEVEGELRKRIETAQSNQTETPRPLSEAEAKRLDKEMAVMQMEIAKTRGRITRLKEYIAGQAKNSDGTELSFNVSTKKNRMLRKAVRHLFGEKRDRVTYSMYVAAKELKRQIETSEADAYVAGDW